MIFLYIFETRCVLLQLIIALKIFCLINFLSSSPISSVGDFRDQQFYIINFNCVRANYFISNEILESLAMIIKFIAKVGLKRFYSIYFSTSFMFY